MSLALCHHDHDDTEVFGHLLSPASKSEGGLFVHFPNDPFKLFSHVAGRGLGGWRGGVAGGRKEISGQRWRPSKLVHTPAALTKEPLHFRLG